MQMSKSFPCVLDARNGIVSRAVGVEAASRTLFLGRLTFRSMTLAHSVEGRLALHLHTSGDELRHRAFAGIELLTVAHHHPF